MNKQTQSFDPHPTRTDVAGLNRSSEEIDVVAESVPVNSLVLAGTPRLSGVDDEHIGLLALVETRLPPILVHRNTMRVIDGAHRVMAAKSRGEDVIEARFFDGSDEEAFVLAVRANISHGLPLSLHDREAAAARIVTSHPDWADRAIASATGLDPKTVGTIRHRTAGDHTQPTARIGRDGRVRPVDNSVGRRRAQQLITQRPTASLREIAREAQISIGTARDVRTRMSRGEDPVARRRPAERPRPQSPDLPTMLRQLADDPALRFSDAGRVVLRWLNARMVDRSELATLTNTVPPHCTTVVAQIAQGCAATWQELADELAKRSDSPCPTKRTG